MAENFPSNLPPPPPIWGTDFLAVSVSSSTLLLSRGAQLRSCYCRVFHNHEENIVNASPQHCSPPAPYPFPFLPPVAVCDEAQPVRRRRWSRPRWRLCCFLLPSPCWMLVLLLSNVFLCILHGAENNGAACSLLKAVPIPPGMKNTTSKNPPDVKWLPPSRSFLGSWRMGFTVIFPGHVSQRHLPSPSDRSFGQRFTSTETHLREVNTQGLEEHPLASLLGNGFPHSLGLTSAIDINYDN